MVKFIVLFLIFPLISSCSIFKDNKDLFISPGRIDRDTLKIGLAPLKHVCHERVNCNINNLEIIAHGAGSYRHFPMKIEEAFS